MHFDSISQPYQHFLFAFSLFFLSRVKYYKGGDGNPHINQMNWSYFWSGQLSMNLYIGPYCQTLEILEIQEVYLIFLPAPQVNT